MNPRRVSSFNKNPAKANDTVVCSDASNVLTNGVAQHSTRRNRPRGSFLSVWRDAQDLTENGFLQPLFIFPRLVYFFWGGGAFSKRFNHHASDYFTFLS